MARELWTQTEVEKLYVCDNSIMPHSGGVPPVLALPIAAVS